MAEPRDQQPAGESQAVAASGGARTAVSPNPRNHRKRQITGDVLNWGVQAILAVIGIVGIVGDSEMNWTFVWCALATLYALVAVIILGTKSRKPTPPLEESSRLWLGRARLPIAWIFTIVPALLGVFSALSVIADQVVASPTTSDSDMSLVVKILGVWAMLLGWAFMHWGYAQIYLLRSDAARPGKILDFPHTDRPGLVDHVYFAFTVGTTFAASDVTILDTRTRWTVTVHSVVSFALNALTIALAFNTIMNAGK